MLVARLAKEKYSGSKDDRKYTQVWRIKADNKEQDAAAIRNAEGIPQQGSTHPSDPLAVLLSKEVERETEKQPLLWIVTCQFGREKTADKTNTDGGKDGKGSENPTEWRPDISWEGIKERVAITDCMVSCGLEFKRNTIPVNTAGFVLEPIPENEESHAACRLTWYQQDWDPEWIDKYSGKLNSKTFWGYDAGRVKCDHIGASLESINGYRLWKVAGQFELKRTWNIYVYNHGSVCRKPDTDATPFERPALADCVTPISPTTGHRLNDVALDSDGYQMDGNEPPLTLEISKYIPTVDFNFFTAIADLFDYSGRDPEIEY